MKLWTTWDCYYFLVIGTWRISPIIPLIPWTGWFVLVNYYCMIRPIDFNGPLRGTWVGFYRGWYGWTNATNLPDFFYSMNVFSTSEACWGIYCSSILYLWSLFESLLFWPILSSSWFCPSSLNFYITEPNEGVDAEKFSYPLMTGCLCWSSSELSSQSLKAFMSLSNCYLEFL
jgi:hypothetical protein